VIAGVVLAAGAGRRFGARKQLADLHGRPLLEHALRAMAAAPVDRVLVVLGADAEEVSHRVDMNGAETVVCDGWETGISASLRAGFDAAGGAGAVAIVLGDQPLISAQAVARVVAARGDAAAVRATYGGVPGHPIVLERELFARARELRGDTGARAVLAGVSVREVACDGLGSPADVDTPDQLARLAGA
jgi:CTP:molybdopterin cytidylyltransferase MocA